MLRASMARARRRGVVMFTFNVMLTSFVRGCVVCAPVLSISFAGRLLFRGASFFFCPNPGGLATFTVTPLAFCFRFLVREFSVVLVPPRVPHGRSIVRVFNAFLLPLRFDEAFLPGAFVF